MRDHDIAFLSRGLASCHCAPVDHEEGTVVARYVHDYAAHVFLAAWNGDIGVRVVGHMLLCQYYPQRSLWIEGSMSFLPDVGMGNYKVMILRLSGPPIVGIRGIN